MPIVAEHTGVIDTPYVEDGSEVKLIVLTESPTATPVIVPDLTVTIGFASSAVTLTSNASISFCWFARV